MTSLLEFDEMKIWWDYTCYKHYLFNNEELYMYTLKKMDSVNSRTVYIVSTCMLFKYLSYAQSMKNGWICVL